jgi:hypothetical protein
VFSGVVPAGHGSHHENHYRRAPDRDEQETCAHDSGRDERDCDDQHRDATRDHHQAVPAVPMRVFGLIGMGVLIRFHGDLRNAFGTKPNF